MFLSNIGRATIIDEGNAHRYVAPPDGLSKGYAGRNPAAPYGSLGYARPRSRPLIPRSEWDERIEKREKERARLVDIWKYHKLPVLDQNGTNYCWIFGPVSAIHVARAAANMPFVYMCPTSTGAKIKNYRNVGGWGGEAIEGINKYGLVPADLWPVNKIDRQYDTPESREAAKLTTVIEWEDLKPGSFDELASCLLEGFPCPVGHNWWGHEVCHLDLVKIGNNQYGTIFVNSWSASWEDGGFAVMAEAKARPDDAQACRVISTFRR